MENFASDQDELYYTSKQYMKLKFSNAAFVENTTKEKQENTKEIDNLKKEYDKLKNDVAYLKKKTLYSTNRLKSANSDISDPGSSQINLLKLKLDLAKSQKQKSKDDWKKLDEKYKDLKSESRNIGDDNNPYTRRIKMLENKLDKAMIKYNEAMSIRRTYEQILERLKDERAGYDNRIHAIQKSLKSKQHDCEEFILLLQDAKQAKTYSEMLLKNTELSRAAFDQHFEQLIKAHERDNNPLVKLEKEQDKTKKNEKLDTKTSEESVNHKNMINSELEQKVREYEAQDREIRKETGADDINEICQKYSNLRDTKYKLKKERKDLEKMCDVLNKKKDELVVELNKMKYQGQDEITRKEIEDNEKICDRTIKTCDETRNKLKKAEKLIVDIRAAINMITELLKSKICDDFFNDERNFADKELSYKQSYEDIKTMGDKNLPLIFSKIMNVCDFLYQKYLGMKETNPEIDENDGGLRIEDDSLLEKIHLQENIESANNSEYGPDDDIDADIPQNNKEHRNDLNSLTNKQHDDKNKGKRFSISARNKY